MFMRSPLFFLLLFTEHRHHSLDAVIFRIPLSEHLSEFLSFVLRVTLEVTHSRRCFNISSKSHTQGYIGRGVYNRNQEE